MLKERRVVGLPTHPHFLGTLPILSLTLLCPGNVLSFRQVRTVGHPVFPVVNFLSIYLLFKQTFTWNSNLNVFPVKLLCSKWRDTNALPNQPNSIISCSSPRTLWGPVFRTYSLPCLPYWLDFIEYDHFSDPQFSHP